MKVLLSQLCSLYQQFDRTIDIILHQKTISAFNISEMEYSRTDSPNRDEDKPDNPLKTVMQAWNEQYVLINTLCEDQAAEEITPTRDADLKDYQEGKFGSMLNNQKQLDKVEIMRASGDLDIALEYLATAHDSMTLAAQVYGL